MDYPDMHRCPICKKSIMNSWNKCPYCNPAPQVDYNLIVKRNNKTRNIIFGFVGFIILISIVASILPDRGTRAGIYNSTVDGSVYEVERYLKDNLKDPKSYESISWGKVIDLGMEPSTPYRYHVHHRYRARNSFGGFVISDQTFYMDKYGNVFEVKDNEE